MTTMPTRTEKELLEMLSSAGRAKEAFTELYERFAGKCYSFVLAMVKDEAVAKDTVHDIFLKVWLRREVISGVDSFSSYIFRMTRNAVFDHFESNALNRKFMASRNLPSEDFRCFVDEKVNADELQLLIYNAVSRMPEQRRKIFTLSRYKGMPNREIAALFDLNIRTVENHLTNALADIREALAKC